MLASGKHSRFAEVQTISATALYVQQLRPAAGVADIHLPVEDDGGVIGGPVMFRNPIGVRHGRWNDGADLNTQLLMMAQTFLDKYADIEKLKAKPTGSRMGEVVELSELMGLRSQLRENKEDVPDAINDRIDHLVKQSESQSMNLHQIPWFLPSLYGDILLTAQGSQTEVEWVNLSPSERLAMTDLGKKFDVDTGAGLGKIVVPKPVQKVEALLAKSMKRGRKLLSAVVFKNGRIEEIHRTEGGEVAALATVEKSEPKAAVTVAQPALSCPVPEFERANVRATRVLREFLSPQQLEDFERTQSFLVTGADSATSTSSPAGRPRPSSSRRWAAGASTTSTAGTRSACTTGRCRRPRSSWSWRSSCRCRAASRR